VFWVHWRILYTEVKRDTGIQERTDVLRCSDEMSCIPDWWWDGIIQYSIRGGFFPIRVIFLSFYAWIDDWWPYPFVSSGDFRHLPLLVWFIGGGIADIGIFNNPISAIFSVYQYYCTTMVWGFPSFPAAQIISAVLSYQVFQTNSVSSVWQRSDPFDEELCTSIEIWFKCQELPKNAIHYLYEFPSSNCWLLIVMFLIVYDRFWFTNFLWLLLMVIQNYILLYYLLSSPLSQKINEDGISSIVNHIPSFLTSLKMRSMNRANYSYYWFRFCHFNFFWNIFHKFLIEIA
jgi:hypothetical protein